jgi:DNA invertase Pin-like site-specific DNA recombinase
LGGEQVRTHAGRAARNRLAWVRAAERGTEMGRPRELTDEDPRAMRAREMRAQGLGVRAIAAELDVSKSTVARFLQGCPKS